MKFLIILFISMCYCYSQEIINPGYSVNTKSKKVTISSTLPLSSVDVELLQNEESIMFDLIEVSLDKDCLIIAIDNSGSMKDKIISLKLEIMDFIQKKNPNTKISLITFADSVSVICQSTDNIDSLMKAVTDIEVHSSVGTSFVELLKFFKKSVCKVAVITDGIPTDDSIRLLKSIVEHDTNQSIFFGIISDRFRSGEKHNIILNELANKTNGLVIENMNPDSLARLVFKISQANIYELAWNGNCRDLTELKIKGISLPVDFECESDKYVYPEPKKNNSNSSIGINVSSSNEKKLVPYIGLYFVWKDLITLSVDLNLLSSRPNLTAAFNFYDKLNFSAGVFTNAYLFGIFTGVSIKTIFNLETGIRLYTSYNPESKSVYLQPNLFFQYNFYI